MKKRVFGKGPRNAKRGKNQGKKQRPEKSTPPHFLSKKPRLEGGGEGDPRKKGRRGGAEETKMKKKKRPQGIASAHRRHKVGGHKGRGEPNVLTPSHRKKAKDAWGSEEEKLDTAAVGGGGYKKKQ